jgi:hypothetical protein
VPNQIAEIVGGWMSAAFGEDYHAVIDAREISDSQLGLAGETV